MLAACNPGFAALLLPLALMAASAGCPPIVVADRSTAILLCLAGPVAAVVLATAEVWAVAVTSVPAAPGWGVLGQCTTACLPGLTVPTLPVAAGLALPLVVTPLACAAAPVASSVPSKTAAPEALVGTAGLLGEGYRPCGAAGGARALEMLCRWWRSVWPDTSLWRH